MKRFITFSFIAMALVFTVIGVVREQKNDATLDVSNALSVIAKQNDMAKCAVVNNKIVFSADDFEGIYVADEKGNAVMYINVGLGECSDGTTWTLSSYPSETTLSNNVSGLLLEVGNG